jgi:hypothetical protein
MLRTSIEAGGSQGVGRYLQIAVDSKWPRETLEL